MPLQIETEIIEGRRAFPDAQALMEGVGSTFGDRFYTVSWAALDRRKESLCLVNENGPLAELVGDHLRFRFGDAKSAIAYCVGAADLTTDAVVTRRVFAALQLLAVQQIAVRVEVLS